MLPMPLPSSRRRAASTLITGRVARVADRGCSFGSRPPQDISTSASKVVIAARVADLVRTGPIIDLAWTNLDEIRSHPSRRSNPCWDRTLEPSQLARAFTGPPAGTHTLNGPGGDHREASTRLTSHGRADPATGGEHRTPTCGARSEEH